MMDPPIKEAIQSHIRIHGNIDHANLSIELQLCDPSTLGWFTWNDDQKFIHGIVFGIENPQIYQYAQHGQLDAVKYLV